MSLFLDTIESTMEEKADFMNLKTLRSSDSIFVFVKVHMKINDDVYKFDFRSNPGISVKMLAGKPGKSTMPRVSQVFETQTGKCLFERYSKCSQIDLADRRPLKLDSLYLERYSNCADMSKELQKRPTPDQPVSTFLYKTTIRYSDLDQNQHTNNSIYVKSCIDCATIASFSNKLFHFKGDMACYPVYEFIVEYLGETFAGDELVVSMWQDTNDFRNFKFLLYKSGEKQEVSFVECKFGLEKCFNKGSKRMIPKL